jgi:hypothetical protein
MGDIGGLVFEGGFATSADVSPPPPVLTSADVFKKYDDNGNGTMDKEELTNLKADIKAKKRVAKSWAAQQAAQYLTEARMYTDKHKSTRSLREQARQAKWFDRTGLFRKIYQGAVDGADGEDHTLTVWRPVCKGKGDMIFGDSCCVGKSEPRLPALFARPLPPGKVFKGYDQIASADWLVPPMEYKLVHTFQSDGLFVWLPVPPSDQYVALGHIVTTTEEAPSVAEMRCLHKSALEPAKLSLRGGIELRGEGTATAIRLPQVASMVIAELYVQPRKEGDADGDPTYAHYTVTEEIRNLVRFTKAKPKIAPAKPAPSEPTMYKHPDTLQAWKNERDAGNIPGKKKKEEPPNPTGKPPQGSSWKNRENGQIKAAVGSWLSSKNRDVVQYKKREVMKAQVMDRNAQRQVEKRRQAMADKKRWQRQQSNNSGAKTKGVALTGVQSKSRSLSRTLQQFSRDTLQHQKRQQEIVDHQIQQQEQLLVLQAGGALTHEQRRESLRFSQSMPLTSHLDREHKKEVQGFITHKVSNSPLASVYDSHAFCRAAGLNPRKPGGLAALPHEHVLSILSSGGSASFAASFASSLSSSMRKGSRKSAWGTADDDDERESNQFWAGALEKGGMQERVSVGRIRPQAPDSGRGRGSSNNVPRAAPARAWSAGSSGSSNEDPFLQLRRAAVCPDEGTLRTVQLIWLLITAQQQSRTSSSSVNPSASSGRAYSSAPAQAVLPEWTELKNLYTRSAAKQLEKLPLDQIALQALSDLQAIVDSPSPLALSLPAICASCAEAGPLCEAALSAVERLQARKDREDEAAAIVARKEADAEQRTQQEAAEQQKAAEQQEAAEQKRQQQADQGEEQQLQEENSEAPEKEAAQEAAEPAGAVDSSGTVEVEAAAASVAAVAAAVEATPLDAEKDSGQGDVEKKPEQQNGEAPTTEAQKEEEEEEEDDYGDDEEEEEEEAPAAAALAPALAAAAAEDEEEDEYGDDDEEDEEEEEKAKPAAEKEAEEEGDDNYDDEEEEEEEAAAETGEPVAKTEAEKEEDDDYGDEYGDDEEEEAPAPAPAATPAPAVAVAAAEEEAEEEEEEAEDDYGDDEEEDEEEAPSPTAAAEEQEEGDDDDYNDDEEEGMSMRERMAIDWEEEKARAAAEKEADKEEEGDDYGDSEEFEEAGNNSISAAGGGAGADGDDDYGDEFEA